ncbi:MAG: DUF3050 domain-containing protein [bacterium]|jgi:hypothetical protein
MNVYINNINKNIEPLRQEIINHKLYSAIRNIEDLKIFMKYHVYAVWDFMSILKTLQNNLTCTSVPWFPVGNADTRFLINEIVVGEESDVDQNGTRKSHFELYLDAMNQCGADTQPIEKFINELKVSKDLNSALILSETPKEATDFVKYTFDIINSGKHYLQSAIFTFGREDLIPGMFISMVNDIHNNFPNEISIFKYYLERHIEIDGDHHSNLALEMTSNLCANNKEFWEQAEIVTIESLKQRINLWDGAYNEIASLQLAN